MGTSLTTQLTPFYHTADSLRRLTKIFTVTASYIRKVNRVVRRGELSNAQVFPWMKEWADLMCTFVNLKVEAIGQPSEREPAILVGNHVSYLDIPMLMSLSPVVFVAKKQIGNWPIIGTAARVVGTILVDRDSKNSRQNITNVVAPFVRDRRQSVVIFPSGTTCVEEKQPWRWGAFRIAQEAGIPVQPFRIRYRPMRLAAYLKEDAFIVHLWKVMMSGGLRATVEFGTPFHVENPEADARRCWEWAREGL